MKILSNILLLTNVFTLFIICTLYAHGFWYLIPIDIITVVYIVKFYLYTHKKDILQYNLWRKEWNYLGTTNDFYQEEVWEHKKTGKRVYL